MSDLAPFVAAVLNDKVVAEMKQQVDNLTERLQKSQAVQIVSTSGTVYAEGQFQEGCFNGNSNVWIVMLHQQLASCLLSNLNNVQICVGGIRKTDFLADSIVEGFVPATTRYMDGWGRIGFRFGGASWLVVEVGPYTYEEVFLSQVDEDIEPENMASFLTQELAVNHPELSVTFSRVYFPISEVEGAIQHLNLNRSKRKRKRVAVAAAIQEENGVEDDTGVEGDVEG
jgi:hypothetical protein